MTASRILVVEDEPVLVEALTYGLTRQGYQVETAADGQSGLEKAFQMPADLVLLDLMLPKLDGWEVCRILRQESKMRIIILTARDSELERVKGLELGADDYITKPFSMRELLARVKAQLRRIQGGQDDRRQVHEALPVRPPIQVGNLAIDPIRHEVRLDGQPLNLQPKEYDLLVFLAEHQSQALRRESILEQVWGWEFIGSTRTVDVHVNWLREKIEPDPQHPVRIVTVRGAGYRFEG